MAEKTDPKFIVADPAKTNELPRCCTSHAQILLDALLVRSKHSERSITLILERAFDKYTASYTPASIGCGNIHQHLQTNICHQALRPVHTYQHRLIVISPDSSLVHRSATAGTSCGQTIAFSNPHQPLHIRNPEPSHAEKLLDRF